MNILTASFLFSIIIGYGLAPSLAFLNLINKVNPSIHSYAEVQQEALLNIHLDINHSNSRLGIHGLLLELHGEKKANYQHPKLPGANGPNPQLSSGPKTLHVLRQGNFVDMHGEHMVNLENGAWELVWRRDAPAGALICGFDVPVEIKRKDASLPKGRLYFTFPVWTSESLHDLRQCKAKAAEKANEAMDRQRDQLRKMQETNNPIRKALHFRNACQASEDIDFSGHKKYLAMPLDRDMISLRGDLFLCSLGTLWTKKEGFVGEQILLGTALASTVNNGKNDGRN